MGHFYNHNSGRPAVTGFRVSKTMHNVQHTCARTKGTIPDHKELLYGDEVSDDANVMELLHDGRVQASSRGKIFAYLQTVFPEVHAGTLIQCRMYGRISGWVWLSVASA